MNQAHRCLACYQALEEDRRDFHVACSKRLFGSIDPPEFPFELKDLEAEGRHVILGRIALTGVQPKLSLEIERERDSTTRRFTIAGLHGQWGEFILKPPSAKYPELPENEDLAMHLAEIAGIRTAQHTLIRMRSGELAYITRRFDRLSSKRGHTQFEMEDMCQLTERLTEDKYKGSMEQIGKIIRKYSTNPGMDSLRFYELARFSALMKNSDMHLKNFALITVGEVTSLSPAYDLLSVALILDDPDEMALSVNGKKRNITVNDWRRFGESLKIKPEVLKASNDQLHSAIPKMFEFIEQGFLSRERKVQLREIIESRGVELLGQ